MLLPAFSAIFLGVFIFKESPLYHQTNRGKSRWFTYFYLALTLMYLIGSVVALLKANLAGTIAAVLLIPNVLGLILLVVLRLIGGKDDFARAGLSGGRPRFWILFGFGLILYYGFQTFLNYLFGMGRIRGVLLLGIIWGIWHWPIIWMGYNFPGHALLGSLAMVAIGIILAFFFAYAVFKAQGVWIAAYLHALNNQVLSFFFMAVFAPTDNLFSFGAGLPGIALGAIAVLLILRDPVWRNDR